MRKIAYVALKLMGLMNLYTAISIGAVFLSSLATNSLVGVDIVSLLASVFMLVAYTAIFWLQIWRTSWLLDVIGIGADEEQRSWDVAALLTVSIKLLGIYVLTQAVPTIFAEVGRALVGLRFSPAYVFSPLALLLRMALGYFMAFQTGKVLTFVQPQESEQ